MVMTPAEARHLIAGAACIGCSRRLRGSGDARVVVANCDGTPICGYFKLVTPVDPFP